MDRRFFLALLLTAVIIAVTPILFPSQPRVAPGVRADSAAALAEARRPLPAEPVPSPIVEAAPPVPTQPDSIVSAPLAAVPAEGTTIKSSVATFRFSNVGAALVAVQVDSYPSQVRPSEKVQLIVPGQPLLRFRLISPGDTLALDRVPFAVSRGTGADGRESIRYSATVEGKAVQVSYTLGADGYTVMVDGTVTGVAENTYLLTDLPTTMPSAESDTADDQRHLASAFKPQHDDASSVNFSRLEPGERKLQPGPLTWAAVKNKYFVIGVLSTAQRGPFSEITLLGGTRTSKQATNAGATLVSPLKAGAFGFEVYAGPQEWKRLVALGRDFDHVNPYGWAFLRGIVQPVAALVIQLLLWMHQVLQLSYGWVLVIFGVVIRLLLWPLNQSAMRSSLKMQEIQPRLAEVQKKFQNNPEKQREEIMKVYKESGASPFTALSGCLPMLIPMPVFFALFFVFQNTIEFRGVPFLWLTDISLKDPFYIIPLLMGVSMFVLSWIGLRNAPPNPQAKMMGYVFPVMMTVMLANMASGLNLYYTAQNVAALPQQWLLARERLKARKV